MKMYGIKWQALAVCTAFLLSGCANGLAAAGTGTAAPDSGVELACMTEEDVTPAELAEHTVRQLTDAGGGLILVTTDSRNQPHAYRQEAQTWQEQDNTEALNWMQDNEGHFRQYWYDATGSWWAVQADSIVQILPDGQTREVALPEDGASEPYVTVTGFADRGDGLVCFAARQTKEKNGPDPGGVWYLVDGGSGTVTRTFSFVEWVDEHPFFYDGNLVLYDGNATTLKQFDAEVGTLLRETVIERPAQLPDAAAMAADGTYEYFVDQSGLYRRPQEADFTQTITDDADLVCLSADFEAVGIRAGEDGTWLVAGNLNGKAKLYQLSVG